MKPKKTKIAAVVATLVLFYATFSFVSGNTNPNSVFLDSDQDGLTDQEEKSIGTDPQNSDTDTDGYQDGKELKSGYNPLKKAPGDALMPARSSGGPTSAIASADDKSLADKSTDKPASLEESGDTTSESASSGDSSSSLLSSDLLNQAYTNQDVMADLSSDPNNPNLTNEMIGQFLKLTQEKASGSEDFLNNPSLSAEDFDVITQNALQTVDIESKLPEIRDDEIKVLPAIDGKNLSEDKLKEKQKAEIEKYLASLAFIFASNSPFPVDQPENFVASMNQEQESLLTAMTTGNQASINAYATRARTGIDQIKSVEVPFVLKDIHKSALQLALYTLDQKDKVTIDPSDPMKNLAALSSLQAVAESTLKLQSQMKTIADEYGITEVELK